MFGLRWNRHLLKTQLNDFRFLMGGQTCLEAILVAVLLSGGTLHKERSPWY